MKRQPLLTHSLQGSWTGDVVLLLNGGMMSYAAWEPVSSRLLADGKRVLLCDLRGQLLTPGKSHSSLDGHVDDVLRLLDELELESVHVLGTSFGAEVALLLAATHPDRVSSLAAVTATDYATPALLRGIDQLRQLASEVQEGGDRGRFHDLLIEEVYSDGYLEAHREELAARRDQIAQLPDVWFLGLEGILACLENLDLRPRLRYIRCPTLVVAAALDETLPPERSQAMAQAIDGALLEEHATSGHALVAEDPEWVADRYTNFLTRLKQ